MRCGREYLERDCSFPYCKGCGKVRCTGDGRTVCSDRGCGHYMKDVHDMSRREYYNAIGNGC